MNKLLTHFQKKRPWNKGKLMGQKAPLTAQEIWSIRMRLQDDGRVRDQALFNLAIDSKLRACDLLKIKVSDISSSGRINKRALISQQKTGRPVRFEITARTRKSIEKWIEQTGSASSDFLFPSRLSSSPHLSTRQYSRIVESWVVWIGLDWSGSGFIRNTLTSTNESNAYLPADQESQGRTAASRAHESRQYRPLSWD